MITVTDKCVACLIIGFICGILGGLIITHTCNKTWELASIKHKAAHYDPITAKFTWNMEEEKEVKVEVYVIELLRLTEAYFSKDMKK